MPTNLNKNSPLMHLIEVAVAFVSRLFQTRSKAQTVIVPKGPLAPLQPSKVETPIILPTIRETVTAPILPDTPKAEPQPTTGFLICPIKIEGQALTPFTVRISAVLDHMGTMIDSARPAGNTWGLNGKDQKVKAFNGEIGDAEKTSTPPFGFTKADHTPFFKDKEINYVSARNSGFYPDNCYLNYDGHSGYDFSYPVGTLLIAPADGELHKAKEDSVNGCNRNWYKKQFGEDNPTAWQGWHVFYIKHQNGFSTWFLHCTNLIDEIEQHIGEDYQKFVPIQQGQIIAYSGSYGGVGPHLHFEVRDKDGKIVDPYSDKLWLE